jgi:phosphatidylserine/phosphatidylglycerophosphate/cardiolipin synthase-like enzyme
LAWPLRLPERLICFCNWDGNSRKTINIYLNHIRSNNMNKIPFIRLAAMLVFVGFIVQAYAVDVAPQIETAFSPNDGGQALVVKVIQSAKKTIRLSAYSFTSPSVARALIDAKRRGVDVFAVVDYKNNLIDDRSGKARKALNLLTDAGVTVRTIASYPIHHDKFIIADDLHVETGSFNYSDSAAKYNSENVLVVWNNPQVAASYLTHWKSRFEQGIDYKSDN